MIQVRNGLLVLLVFGAGLALTREAHAADRTMHLYIPRLALDVPVSECVIVDGWHDTSQLGDGICHLEGTATLAHDWARVVLAGHTPGGFSRLVDVQRGDQLVLWDGARVEAYTVALVTIVEVSDTQWLMPTDDETLTLITCAGAQRRIVHATRQLMVQ